MSYINMDQQRVYIWPLPPEPRPISFPILTFEAVTEQWVELPVKYNKFPFAIYFTYGNIYVSMLYSQFILSFPFPTVYTCLFSMSAYPVQPCK